MNGRRWSARWVGEGGRPVDAHQPPVRENSSSPPRELHELEVTSTLTRFSPARLAWNQALTDGQRGGSVEGVARVDEISMRPLRASASQLIEHGVPEATLSCPVKVSNTTVGASVLSMVHALRSET